MKKITQVTDIYECVQFGADPNQIKSSEFKLDFRRRQLEFNSAIRL